MPTSSYKRITSADWSSKLGALGEIVEGTDDIWQCINIILTTHKGSLPHRLDFGCNLWNFIDLPITVAKARIILEASQALAKWEPRAVVDSISAERQSEHHFNLTITWHPANSISGSAASYVQEVVV